MTPKSFPSLGLRDPGFLRSSGFTPDPADPNLFGWWSADQYVTQASNVVSVWGDRSNNTVNKAALTGTRNLIPVGGFKIRLSNNDGTGNLCFASQDMTNGAWTTFNFTKNTATTGTFTGTGGVINIYPGMFRNNVSYTLKATMRAVTGNTNLEWVTFGSSSGNYTPVTITGALADYTRVFLGNGGSIYCGIRDNNAAGFGQIEVTKWQIYETGWGATPYVDTGTSGDQYYIPTLGGKQVIWTHGLTGAVGTRCFLRNESFTDVSDITKLTAYFAIYWPQTTANLGAFFTNRYVHTAWAWFADLNPTDQSAYVNTAPFARLDTGSAVPSYGFSIFTGVYDGANSSVRVNKNAAVTGTLGTIPANEHHGIELGESLSGTCSTCGFYEVIVRRVRDDTATQDLYIDYLAKRVGIVV